MNTDQSDDNAQTAGVEVPKTLQGPDPDSENVHERDQVYVPVVDLRPGRQIGRDLSIPDLLKSRVDDITRAVEAASEAVVASVKALPQQEQWRLNEVSASFGITLAAEAGVILSKASASSTFEVTLTFQRQN